MRLLASCFIHGCGYRRDAVNSHADFGVWPFLFTRPACETVKFKLFCLVGETRAFARLVEIQQLSSLVPSSFCPSAFALATRKDARTKAVEELRGIELADVACGRNHSVAVERAPRARVFTWGFGG